MGTFMLRLQSGGCITLMVIRAHAKEGWAGRARSKPPFFTMIDEFMKCQWCCHLLLDMAGWALFHLSTGHWSHGTLSSLLDMVHGV